MRLFYLYTLCILTLCLGCKQEIIKTIEDNSTFSQSSIAKAKTLLAKLTLEEKVGQMTQLTIPTLQTKKSFDPKKLEKAIVSYGIGSFLNIPKPNTPSPKEWNKVIKLLDSVVQTTKHKIPVLYGIDAIHGASYTAGATLFPQQIGLAATWNTNLIEESAKIAAYETRASSIPWVFSPDLDLARNPVWSRLWECFGEDAYLNSQMGAAMVKGFEGKSVDDPYHVATCIKHFVGYGSTATGKDRTPAYIPDRVLKQYDLTIYKAAIEAGAKSIMINSGEINGTPVHANKHLLTTVLKEELGFGGVVLTDWQDIRYLFERHKVAKNYDEAITIAINAGIDMSMVPDDYLFCEKLKTLVENEKIPMSRIDDAVTKILALKYELGLFENSGIANSKDYPDFGSQKHQNLAYKAASESITLLKNKDNILPLNKQSKVLITGATANSMKYLNGGWTMSWQGQKADEYLGEKNTILEAFQKKLGVNNVLYEPGVSIFKEIDISKAVLKAQQVDVIILCVGEHNYTEGKGDISSLAMTAPQQKLAEALLMTGKPVVLVLNEGRPRTITAFEEKVNATLQCYLPGSEGSNALVDIIYGDVNPSGKLPYTYPRYTNELVKYNRKYTESIGFDELKDNSKKFKAQYNPLYEFGYGLSYSNFEYLKLSLDKTNFSKKDTLTISVTIKNNSQKAGKEVVQLYSRDVVASITPEVKVLRKFKKVYFKALEEKTITFQITPQELAFVNTENKWIIEPGEFILSTGTLSQKINFN